MWKRTSTTTPTSTRATRTTPTAPPPARSEEHTSELQSRLHLVCRLLLEKKNSHMRSRVRSGRPYRPVCLHGPAEPRHPHSFPTRRSSDLSSAPTPRESSTTAIGQRIAPYDIVHVEEDFNYHANLYAGDTNHAYRTPTSEIGRAHV